VASRVSVSDRRFAARRLYRHQESLEQRSDHSDARQTERERERKKNYSPSTIYTVVKVRGNAGNAVSGPLKIAGERSQAPHNA